MATYQYFVLTRAEDGRLKEFEDWYDNIHLAEVCAVPGIKSAKRFKVKRIDSTVGEQQWDSMAVYEFDTEDPDGIIAELVRQAGSGQMNITTSMSEAGIQLVTTPVSSYP